MRIEEYCKKCREINEYAPCCSVLENSDSERVIGAKFKKNAPRKKSKRGNVCALCPHAIPYGCALGENRPQRCKEFPTPEDIILNKITCPECLIRKKLEEEFKKLNIRWTDENWKNFLKHWEEYL
jgi:hypothetical protein